MQNIKNIYGENAKHPPILPNNSKSTHLIIHEAHGSTFHGGTESVTRLLKKHLPSDNKARIAPNAHCQFIFIYEQIIAFFSNQPRKVSRETKTCEETDRLMDFQIDI